MRMRRRNHFAEDGNTGSKTCARSVRVRRRGNHFCANLSSRSRRACRPSSPPYARLAIQEGLRIAHPHPRRMVLRHSSFRYEASHDFNAGRWSSNNNNHEGALHMAVEWRVTWRGLVVSRRRMTILPKSWEILEGGSFATRRLCWMIPPRRRRRHRTSGA